MRNSTKFALSTLAATAMFGTLGAVGTSTASADTLHELDPRSGTGAHCVVVDDEGSELLLFSPTECSAAQQDIDSEERREERREERKEERQQDASGSAATA